VEEVRRDKEAHERHSGCTPAQHGSAAGAPRKTTLKGGGRDAQTGLVQSYQGAKQAECWSDKAQPRGKGQERRRYSQEWEAGAERLHAGYQVAGIREEQLVEADDQRTTGRGSWEKAAWVDWEANARKAVGRRQDDAGGAETHWAPGHDRTHGERGAWTHPAIAEHSAPLEGCLWRLGKCSWW